MENSPLLWRRMALMPSRMILWSSTSKTLNAMLYRPRWRRLLHRASGFHDRTLSSGAVNCKADTVLRGIVSHKQKPESTLKPPLGLVDRKSDPVIPHFQHRPVARQPKQNLGSAETCMLDRIVQCKLGDLVQNRALVRVDADVSLGRQSNRPRSGLAETAHQTLQREGQAGAFHHRRVQLVTEPSEFLDHPFEHGLDFRGALHDPRRLLAKIHAQHIQLKPHGAQHLTGSIVQDTRHPRLLALALVDERHEFFSQWVGDGGRRARRQLVRVSDGKRASLRPLYPGARVDLAYAP